jgi:hypothetical protein
MSLAVFSENYASSGWCLDELVTILESRKMGQIVIPVFYNIDPSQIRHQTGSYAHSFARHEERFNEEKVIKWRDALREASNLSGWNLGNTANGYVLLFPDLFRLILNNMKSELSYHL